MSTRIFWIILVLFIPSLITTPFTTRGEPREALVAQAMIQTGNYILPSVYDGNVPSKPPMFHWLIVGASKIFGGSVTEFSSRFPSWFVSLIFGIFLYRLLVKRTNNEIYSVGVIATLFSSFEWLRASLCARVDMAFSVFLATALLLGFIHFEKNKKIFGFLNFIFLSLAVLTKGPVAIILYGLIFTAFFITENGFKLAGVFSKVFSLSVFCFLSAIPPVLWYLSAYNQNPDLFLNKVWYENFSRMLGTMQDEPHKHSIFYMLGMLLLGTLPWGIFPFFIKNRFSEYIKTPLAKFSFIAASTIILFFLIPSSKRGQYLLPAYPFIHIVLWEGLKEYFASPKKTFIVLSNLVSSFLLIVIVAVVVYKTDSSSISFISQSINNDLLRNMLVYPFFGGLILFLNFSEFKNAVSFALVLLSVMLFLQTGPIASVQSAMSSEDFSDEINTIVPSNETIYSAFDEFYDISFYTKRQFFRIESNASANSSKWVVLFNSKIDEFQKRYGKSVAIINMSADNVGKQNDFLVLGYIS